jgi:hypothetical protein
MVRPISHKMMIDEYFVESGLEEETDVFGENLPQ